MKSTAINCILGTKQVHCGEVFLLGRDPGRERRELFQKIGVQFQEGDYQQEIRVQELCEETACTGILLTGKSSAPALELEISSAAQ